MTIDILLTLLNVLWGLLLGGTGIEMGNNPPGEVRWKKWLYRGLFTFFGTAVVVTTFAQSVRTAKQQDEARQELHGDQLASQKQISYMSGKLDTVSELLTKYAIAAPTQSPPRSDFSDFAKTLAAIAKSGAQVRSSTPSSGRLLTDEQEKVFSKDMAAIPPQLFFTITETNDRDSSSEQMMFTAQLSEMLRSAKWTNLTEELNAGRINRIVPIPYIKPVSQRGVILYSPQKMMPYAVALANELDKFSIQHTPVRTEDWMGGNHSMPVDFIIIEVGLQ